MGKHLFSDRAVEIAAFRERRFSACFLIAAPHTKKGALWGLGIGAITGLATSSLLVANADYPVDGEGIIVAANTSLLALIGSGIGAWIGSLLRDRTVIYETPDFSRYR